MVGGSFSPVWYKCVKCKGGFDFYKTKCPHCGHEHSKEEIYALKKMHFKKSSLGMIIAAIIFIPLFYIAFKYG